MIRRKNYLIKKKFQLPLLFRFVLLIVLASLLVVGLFTLISGNTLTTGYSNSILRVENTPRFFFPALMLVALISAMGIAIIGTVIFISLSHRIAGPLHRFEEVLQNMEKGDLTSRVNLRKNDQLIEFKTALNLLMESLDRKVRSIKKSTSEMDEILSKEDGLELAAKLKIKVGDIKKELKDFKVS